MMSGVYHVLHLMVGVDYHDTWPPGSPAPVGPTPHVASQFQGGLNLTAQHTGLGKMVLSHNLPVIKRGSDIGPFIGHVGAPNLMLPIILVASGSVAEFGSFTVHVQNSPTAAAIGVMVGINLNCQGPTAPPLPLPTSVVTAVTTNFVGISLLDAMLSLVSMGADMIVGAIANKLGAAIGKGLGNLAMKVIPLRYVFMAGIVASRFPTAAQYASQAGGYVIGTFVTGSPVGYSPGYTPMGGVYGNLRENALQSMHDYFYDPSVESF